MRFRSTHFRFRRIIFLVQSIYWTREIFWYRMGEYLHH